MTMFAALLLTMGPVQLQAAPPPATGPVTTVPRQATTRVALDTSAGRIVLELETERAPVTSANFLRYVGARRFDGIAFYRALNVAPGFGLVQAGQRDPRRLYPPIAHEPTSETGLRHEDGTISMARGAPGSAVADWFITLGAMDSLDANPAGAGDNLGFAAFGRVVEGMDVVRAVLAMPTDPNRGEGVMRGQMLAAPVTITAARVEAPPR